MNSLFNSDIQLESEKLVPAGGNTADVLTKISENDYDIVWAPSSRGESGGAIVPNYNSITVVASSSTINWSSASSASTLTWTATKNCFIKNSITTTGLGLASNEFSNNATSIAINGTNVWSGSLAYYVGNQNISSLMALTSTPILVRIGDVVTYTFLYQPQTAKTTPANTFNIIAYDIGSQISIIPGQNYIPDYTTSIERVADRPSSVVANQNYNFATWTSTLTGFIQARCYVTSTAAVIISQYTWMIYINNIAVWGAPSASFTASGQYQISRSPIIPVMLGDKVDIISSSGSAQLNINGSMWSYLPKLVTAPNVNYIYSTTEVNTGKVWVDGSPIYRKVVNYNYNNAATSANVIITIPASQWLGLTPARIINSYLSKTIGSLSDPGLIGSRSIGSGTILDGSNQAIPSQANLESAIKTDTGTILFKSNQPIQANSITIMGWVEYIK